MWTCIYYGIDRNRRIDMDELTFYTTITLSTEDVSFTFNNFPIYLLGKVNEEFMEMLLNYKWYMKGNYDVIELLGDQFIISNKTKKKITLIKFNKVKDTI